MLLSACTTVGPDFKRPDVPWLSTWRPDAPGRPENVRPATPAEPLAVWWRNFRDPVLDDLIAEAQRANPGVRIAGLRILEARAQQGIAGSTRYPQVQQVTGEALAAGEHRAGGRDTSALALNAGFRVGWELDFWGRFRRGIEAADAGYLASIAQYDDMQVLMAAQVASLYCTIRTTEARLRIVQENAVLQKRSLEIAERLFQSGNDSELDVQQARSLYLGTLATRPPLEAARRQAENALNTLLGRPPGSIPAMADGRGVIPSAPLGTAADIPADLLRRRADVRAAEHQMAAQSALIGVSVADLYPAVSLLGSVGLSATSLSGASNVVSWGVGPGIVWNVFDQGRLSHAVLVQDARFQQLHEQYQDTVRRAAREVDDAAVDFASTGEQIALLEQSTQAAQRSLDIATLQYREGLVDFERVLDSQRVLFSQQEQLVAGRGNLSQSLIAL
ncbi:MAG: efflux transporter outer membrane subunit, partial [Rhizobacter sp.]